MYFSLVAQRIIVFVLCEQQASLVFSDLIESLIVDIATEAHRAARLGFDYKLNVEEEEEVRLAAHARAVVGDAGAVGTEIGNKHTIDVFGQTHPTIANEMFECMNCGRPIVAGRFAPHLEKCMGKVGESVLSCKSWMQWFVSISDVQSM
jgi:SAGA-associated factor 11